MPSKRVYIIMLAFLLIALGLLSKLGYYQIINGREIARQAVNMRSRQVELKEYSRGDILDRNLLPLTGTRSETALYCLPQEILAGNSPASVGNKSGEASLLQAAHLLSAYTPARSAAELYEELQQAAALGQPFVRIASQLDPDDIASINSAQLPGVVIAPVIKRYRDDGFMAHLLGYISGGSANEGISGLEKRYDSILRERAPSLQLASVLDARGVAIEGLMFKLRDGAEQGGSVVLTIDKRIQESVEEAMDRKVGTGAAVVMDISSKEVLAMVSRPAFNPYQVERVIADDEGGSLNNRALMPYHPGSLFKILVAAAALEEKLVVPEEHLTCPGLYSFNEKVAIPCMREKGHGEITFAQAFALSCNPVFIETGLRLRRDGLLGYAQRLCLADETLLGYGDYEAGSGIAVENAEAALGNACLGQEGVMMTPLQICNMLATIADGGRYASPRLVRHTVDLEGEKQVLSPPAEKQVLSPATARTIRQLMEKAVNEGTGKTAALLEARVAGKTATSQTGNYDDKGNEILNTWFAGFLPADNPRWAIVVLVEGGQSGAQNAAPVFKEIARRLMLL